jgi:hypothetical protein
MNRSATALRIFGAVETLAAAHSSLVDEGVAARVVITARDDVIRIGIAGAAIDFSNQFNLAESRVLQIDDFSTGEDRLARGPALGDGQNHIVGQARKVQGLRFAGPTFELPQTCQRKYGTLLEPRAQQSSNGVARRERLLTGTSDAYEFDAAGIVEAGSAGCDKLLHFGVADLELAELLDTLEVHAALIERRRVGVPRVAAACDGRQDQHSSQRNARALAGKCAAGFRHRAQHTSILVRAAANGETPCLADTLLVRGLKVDPKRGQSKVQTGSRKQPCRRFF